MDIDKMRNIVILKNLPSNLVDEAFVVLKENQKINRFEYVESKTENFSNSTATENENDYVVKEAELLISNYISKLENQDLTGRNANIKLIKKYKKLKMFSCIIAIALIISCFLHL